MPKIVKIDFDYAQKLYEVEGLEHVAKKIGVCRETLRKHFHKQGILVKPKYWVAIRDNKKYQFKKGSIPPNKKEKPGYYSLHGRVERVRGRASEYQCSCGKQAKHWANISREYKIDVNDFKAMCVSCHKRYDVGDMCQKRLHKFSLENTYINPMGIRHCRACRKIRDIANMESCSI